MSSIYIVHFSFSFKEQNHYMVRKGHQNQAFDTADECQATPNVRVRT